MEKIKRTSTQDKYRRVSSNKFSSEQSPKYEIRITKRTASINGYILYAVRLLLKENEEFIVLKAAGNAVSRAVLAVEVLRHKISGLHQINKIDSVDVRDEYVPIEEGLDRVVLTKKMPVLEIKLTFNPTEAEIASPFYQPPLSKDKIKEIDLKKVPKERPEKSKERRNKQPRQKKQRSLSRDKDYDRKEYAKPQNKPEQRDRDRSRSRDDRRPRNNNNQNRNKSNKRDNRPQNEKREYQPKKNPRRQQEKNDEVHIYTRRVGRVQEQVIYSRKKLENAGENY